MSTLQRTSNMSVSHDPSNGEIKLPVEKKMFIFSYLTNASLLCNRSHWGGITLVTSDSITPVLTEMHDLTPNGKSPFIFDNSHTEVTVQYWALTEVQVV